MPRNKGLTSSKQVRFPTRVQDGTDLTVRSNTTLIDTFITPIEERVEVLEGATRTLIEQGTLQQATVQLRHGGRGGSTYIEPEGGFSDEAIGRPALIAQAPNGDADEGGIVLFTGLVIDRRRLLVRWFTGFPAPSEAAVLYVIG